jgi:hypothetical protein
MIPWLTALLKHTAISTAGKLEVIGTTAGETFHQNLIILLVS